MAEVPSLLHRIARIPPGRNSPIHRQRPRGNTGDGALQNLNAKNSAAGVVISGSQHNNIGSVTNANAIES